LRRLDEVFSTTTIVSTVNFNHGGTVLTRFSLKFQLWLENERETMLGI
jgi:hypothetical protein